MSEPPTKPIKLTFNVIDRNAKKLATLVKMANLNYDIEETHDDTAHPHVLSTPNG